MFLRVVRAAGGQGVKHEYVRVVEAYRERGKTRHRTVLNLGRRDLLASHLDLNKLMRLLHGDAASDGRVRREDVQAVAAWDWGPMLVAGHIWRELGLEATLDRLARRGRSDATALSDRALVLVANRLTAQGSEHGLARWLETDFVSIATAAVGLRRGARMGSAGPARRTGRDAAAQAVISHARPVAGAQIGYRARRARARPRLHRRPQPKAQRRSVRLHPERNRAVDRM